MLLNVNRWLAVGGKLLITTPNGTQFSNPLRRKSPTPEYRSNVYERHSFLFMMEDLVDLVELCGFKVVETGYWQVYEQQGLARIYDLLAHVPVAYFRAQFMKTIYLVGEKRKEARVLFKMSPGL